MSRKSYFALPLGLAAAMVVAGLFAQSHFASAQQEEPEGRIVQIGPDKGESAELPAVREEQPQEVGYWIGVTGRNIDSDVLRTQLQLAEDTGVVIEQVVADSPADKAGLRKHDIILRANGDMVDSMVVLQEFVSQGKEKPIELKVLRLGQETTISVTPEQRPDDFDQLAQEAGPFDRMPGRGDPFQQLFRQFNEGGLPGGFRVFGPGMVFNNKRMDMSSLPNGVSVSITRENDEPAQITVKKGDQTWTLNSDDAEALKKLPQDVQLYVERLMSGQGIDIQKELGNIDWQAELEHMLPDGLGNLPAMQGLKQQEDRVMQRMQELEQRIERLQEQLEESE